MHGINKLPDIVASFVWLIVLAFLAIIILCRKLPKSDLKNYYGIDAKTISKWTYFFPCTVGTDGWSHKRKLTHYEMESIKQHWGPDKNFVMNKKQMKDILGATYKSLSRAVIPKLNELGLTLEAWENCRTFPPIITKRILEIA